MADTITMRLNSRRFGDRVRSFIAAHERDVDRIVYRVATKVLGDVVEGWPVDTGVSRSAWRGPVRGAESATWRLTNPVAYAVVIEFGGYPGVGPKTTEIGGTTFPGGIRVGGGIFPSQRPHAPVRRALSANRLEISNEIRAEMRRKWGR